MVNKNILSYPVIVWYCMRGSIAITIVLTWIFFVGDIVWSSFSSAAKERAMKLHGYSPSSLFMKKSFLFLPPLRLPLTYHGWPLSTHKWPGSLMGDPWPINDDPNTLNGPQTLKPGTIIDNPETPNESPLDLSSSPGPFLILATSTDVVRIYGITTFAFSYVVVCLSSVVCRRLHHET